MREYVILSTEQTYGTFNTGTPTVLYIALDSSNAFKVEPKPVVYSIKSAGSLNKRYIRGSQKTKVDATLTTHLYAEQAATLLGWAATEINSAQTAPWTTTEPIGDLASVTLDHFVTRADGTTRSKRYLGCKVKTWAISCDNQNDIASLTLGLSIQKYQGNTFDSSSDPTLTAPTLAQLPVNVYAFQHSAGQLTIGSARTNYKSFSLEGKNNVFEPFDEGRFIARSRYRGRQIDWRSALEQKGTPDDFVNYLTQAQLAAQIEFVNGAHSVTINFEGSNFVDAYDEDRPLDADNYTDLHLASYLNATAGADLAITVV